MRIGGAGPVEILIVLLVIVVLFGPWIIKRLKQTGKEMKKAVEETKDSMADEDDEEERPAK